MKKEIKKLMKLSALFETAAIAAAVAEALADIAPEKAMEYDSIYIDNIAEAMVTIKQL